MTATAETVVGTLSTMGDDEQLTTTRIMRDAARSFGDQRIHHCTVDGAWHTTDYAAAWDRIGRMASGLRSIGVGAGDHVGLLMWNDIRHFESYFSIPMLGATMVQLNLRLAPQEIGYVIGHSQTTTIIVDSTLIALAEGLRPHLPAETRWIIAGDGELPEGWADQDNVYSYEDLVTRHQPLEEVPNVDERTASGACYTTGTTGRPKGVFYSHRSTWLHAAAIVANLGITMRDTAMFLTPMFHAQCWGLPYAAASVGAEVVLPGRFTITDVDRLTDTMVERKVTVAPAAPAILLPMLERIRAMEQPPRLDGVRLVCGATEPPVAMMKDFDRLTGAEVIHAYGATETSPAVTMNRMKPSLAESTTEDQAWELKSYQGLPIVGVDLRVVDPMGTQLPPGGEDNVGEIRLRGPWITRSYAQNPEATENGFDDEGFWCSGDAGYLTQEGYLKVTDRMKDVIKSGGEWISSIDLENHILTLDGISDATVIGVPHPDWQERPLALVVRAEGPAGAAVTVDDVRAVLAQRFAKWQLPDEVRFVEEIDRTSVGKINKRLLRTSYADAYDRSNAGS